MQLAHWIKQGANVMTAEIYLMHFGLRYLKKKKKTKTVARIPGNHQQSPQSYKSAVETKFICSTYA